MARAHVTCHTPSTLYLMDLPLSPAKESSRECEPGAYDTRQMLDQAAATIIFHCISSFRASPVARFLGMSEQVPGHARSAQSWEALCQEHEPPLSPCTSMSAIELWRFYTAKAEERSDISMYLLNMQTPRLRLVNADHHLRDDEHFNNPHHIAT